MATGGCFVHLINTEAFQHSRRERKKVETRFAPMKRILRLDQLRLRGLNGVRDEVLLTATAQNLRRLAKLLCRARHFLELRRCQQTDSQRTLKMGPAKTHN